MKKIISVIITLAMVITLNAIMLIQTEAKVKNIPKRVTIKSVALASETTAKVKWRKIKGAKGYHIYYSKKRKGPYKKIIVKGTKKTSVKIKNLKKGNTYYFKIKAYTKKGKKKILSKKFSKIKKVKVQKQSDAYIEEAKTWTLVWSDEFNGTTLDTTKWTGNGVEENYGSMILQEYDIERSEVKDGNLIIKPQFKRNTETKQAVAGSYVSAKIWTKGLYSVKYGKIEFRVKLPKGKGTCSLAWIRGIDNEWPLCGEADIFETKVNSLSRVVTQSIYCNRFCEMVQGEYGKKIDTTVNNSTEEYHLYGIIWDENEIIFTVDGKETWTYNPDEYSENKDGNSDANIWPFNQKCYLAIDSIIGGTCGGVVSPEYWTKVDVNGNIETYEDYFYIDYVRVYQ